MVTFWEKTHYEVAISRNCWNPRSSERFYDAQRAHTPWENPLFYHPWFNLCTVQRFEAETKHTMKLREKLFKTSYCAMSGYFYQKFIRSFIRNSLHTLIHKGSNSRFRVRVGISACTDLRSVVLAFQGFQQLKSEAIIVKNNVASSTKSTPGNLRTWCSTGSRPSSKTRQNLMELQHKIQ